jgi:hypothetical protein
LLAIDENPAAVVGDQSIDYFEQGRFTAAAGTDNADEFVGPHRQVDSGQGGYFCGVMFDGLLKGFGNTLDFNHLAPAALVSIVSTVPIVPTVQTVSLTFHPPPRSRGRKEVAVERFELLKRLERRFIIFR